MIASLTELTNGELERVKSSTEVNSKTFQLWGRRGELGSLFAVVVLVKEATVGSGTGWDWVSRPLGAGGEGSLARSEGRDAGSVGLLLPKLDPVEVIGKLKWSRLKALLSQTLPPLWSNLTKSVGVSSPMVRCDPPSNLHRLTSSPCCGHNVPEREVLGPGSVAITTSWAIASLPRPCIWWATTRVSTGNATTRMHW